MKRAISRFLRHIENKLLRTLLCRYRDRAIAAPCWGTSELVDCITEIVEVIDHADA